LAIEEQFYLVWPPVLLLLLTRFRNRWRPVGAVVTVVGAVASAVAMALLYHPGSDPSRVYFGTDTRSFGILAGAALAMATAARAQPGARAQRSPHLLGPLAAVAIGVFWVNDGTPEGCRDPSCSTGAFWSASGSPSWSSPISAKCIWARSAACWLSPRSYGSGGSPMACTSGIGRSSCTSTRSTGIDGAGLDLLRVGVTILLAAASYYLVEMPIRRRTFARHLRVALAPACVAATGAAPAHGDAVPGAGGFEDQKPIRLAADDPVSSTHPLRVLLIGDSELFVAYPGMAAAFGATGEATVSDRAYPGWGLSKFDWRTEIPTIISQLHPQIIVAGWTWDDALALQEPKRYRDELESAVRLMLAPGDGVQGVVFAQLPPSGPYDTGAAGNSAEATAQRTAGEEAFERLARSLPAVFPGKVMYLPVASSVLLDGRFTSWLPPADAPHTPRAEWQRVRMVDNVHLCPAGVVRYADALLSDFVELFHLPAAAPGWWNGTWTSDPRYYTPAGSCPGDHPPA
ncbi:MAG TPA: SGNH/GDSL hydrolase family protein, partial [Acidimicrobiales bacterium]|nr:SGNH/GDSL hydrolase family protein [Acidimicrobiales bacterium]